MLLMGAVMECWSCVINGSCNGGLVLCYTVKEFWRGQHIAAWYKL